uniref:Uncharacterized protein n=1 Tax=Arundo donax TaxID=35708 RepID=A0A0A9GED5_ARUDO
MKKRDDEMSFTYHMSTYKFKVHIGSTMLASWPK